MHCVPLNRPIVRCGGGDTGVCGARRGLHKGYPWGLGEEGDLEGEEWWMKQSNQTSLYFTLAAQFYLDHVHLNT